MTNWICGHNVTPRLIGWLLTHLKLIYLAFGIIVGTSLGIVIISLRQFQDNEISIPQIDHMKRQNESGKSFHINKLRTNSSLFGYQFTSDNSEVADNLTSNIRILCWVWCSGRDLYNQTAAIHKTWGRKCNILLIFTDSKIADIDTIAFSGVNVAYSLSRYIMAYRYAYKYYKDSADWFFGTFDETYVCMENLRLFLSTKDPNEPVYYGHKLYLKEEYLEFVDARVGCILSKEALDRLGRSGNEIKECNEMDPAGEKQLGACLNNLDVKIGKSNDSLGRTLFLSFPPALQMGGLQSSWFIDQDMEGRLTGVESISRYAITFSGMTAFFMYGIECYLYHMRPAGIFPLDPDLDEMILHTPHERLLNERISGNDLYDKESKR